jgi:low temperature requirement protein LtrA
VTNIELFFDLVYVFAVTQLSHFLLAHATAAGALEAGLLLVMVWLLWTYTTWVTNWLDPERIPVRIMLLGLMLASLILSAGLPGAFAHRGWWVGTAYAVMQVGRSLFAVAALGGDPLRRNFQRILAWCAVSGALAVAGGLIGAAGARAGLWIAAVAVDLGGGATGFRTPGLGRSRTRDWTISGGHFAERCQAFVLIALGESIVVTGSTLSSIPDTSGARAAALGLAFAGAAAMWWVYFDRSARAATEVIERSADPGRLGRSAYHMVHPIMVAGIIVTAAADERVLAHPAAHPDPSTAWMILGGTGLFLAGHATFTYTVWRAMPWLRVGAIAGLAGAGAVATSLPALGVGAIASAVLVVVAGLDRPPSAGAEGSDGSSPTGGGAVRATRAIAGGGGAVADRSADDPVDVGRGS